MVKKYSQGVADAAAAYQTFKGLKLQRDAILMPMPVCSINIILPFNFLLNINVKILNLHKRLSFLTLFFCLQIPPPFTKIKTNKLLISHKMFDVDKDTPVCDCTEDQACTDGCINRSVFL